MKKYIIIAVVLGLLGAMLVPNAVLAFNPQPEPPGMPEYISGWFQTMFPVRESSAYPGERIITPIGSLAAELNPARLR